MNSVHFNYFKTLVLIMYVLDNECVKTVLTTGRQQYARYLDIFLFFVILVSHISTCNNGVIVFNFAVCAQE